MKNPLCLPAALALLAVCGVAQAQLVPPRTYDFRDYNRGAYGPDRGRYEDRDRRDYDRRDNNRWDYDHRDYDRRDDWRYDDRRDVGPHGGYVPARPGVTTTSGYRAPSVIGSNPGNIRSQTNVTVGPSGRIISSTTTKTVEPYRMRHYSRDDLHGYSVYAHRNIPNRRIFDRDWYNRNPGTWAFSNRPQQRFAGRVDWDGASRYIGISGRPIAYDYGSTIVYNGGTTYLNGQPLCSVSDYSRQAFAIAESGRRANVSINDDWQTLGVFGLLRDQTAPVSQMFEIAVNQNGIIRGNYNDSQNGIAYPISGAVDIRSQRAVWMIGDRNHVVYEAGYYNLMQEATPMLVHFNDGREEQVTLVKINY